MDESLNDLLVRLSAKVRGIELTNILRTPPEKSWVCRGFRECVDRTKRFESVEYMAATPNAAVAMAAADNPTT